MAGLLYLYIAMNPPKRGGCDYPVHRISTYIPLYGTEAPTQDLQTVFGLTIVTRVSSGTTTLA
jgi:hypothetical protein